MCLAIPGKILEIQNDSLRTGRVAFGQVVKEVALAFVPEAVVGDYVVVHAGTALEVVDEEAAQSVFRMLAELDDLNERASA